MIVLDTGVLFRRRRSARPRPLTLRRSARCPAELLERYTDLALGLIDAAVITVAERLGATAIAPPNERDFRVVRPGHVEAFTRQQSK